MFTLLRYIHVIDFFFLLFDFYNSLSQGVETEKCPSMKAAMKFHEPTSVEIRSTLADGLAVPTVGYNAYLTVKPIIDKLVRLLIYKTHNSTS